MDSQRDHRSGRDPRVKHSRRRYSAPRSLRATRAGWCFIAIIFGVGFAALNTGNNLLYLVLALMLAFLVLSGFLSEASLRGIGLERKIPRELFASAANRIVLRVHNSQKRVSSFAISLEDHVEGDEGPDSAGRAFALRVGPRETVSRSYAYEPARRGETTFDRVRVSTRFPFGLFVKSREIELPEQALVYPRIYSAALPDDAIAADQNPEEQTGHARRGDEVAGLREFIPGDGLGRVQWRRSLRAGRLLVGEREGEAAGEVEVLLSLTDAAAGGAFEERVSRTASEIVSALDAGLRVGLRSSSVRFVPASGLPHRTDLLSYLARVEPETSADSREASANRPRRSPNAHAHESSSPRGESGREAHAATRKDSAGTMSAGERR